jgi:hypothetical protein
MSLFHRKALRTRRRIILAKLIYLTGAALVFLTTMAIFALLCGKGIIRLRENIIGKLTLSRINSFFVRGFLFLHIPLIFFMVGFCAIEIFFLSPDPAPLLYATIIALCAFVLEQVIEHIRPGMEIPAPGEPVMTNKAVFAYIDLYREIERINRDLIEQIALSQSGLLNQFELTQKNYMTTEKHIDGYIQLQDRECKKLLEKRNKLQQLFTDLGDRADQFSVALAQYTKKLEISDKSLFYYEKGAFLIEDINESFASRYKQTSNEISRRLEDTEKQLRKLVDKYSQFKEHFRPLSEKMDLYGARMDSTVKSLQESGESKKAALEDTGNKIAKALEEINDRMEKTLQDTDQFLRKNSFVLSKILETYRTNAFAPRELKKILSSWQALSLVNTEKE